MLSLKCYHMYDLLFLISPQAKKKLYHDLLLIIRMPGQDVVMQIQGRVNDRKKSRWQMTCPHSRR